MDTLSGLYQHSLFNFFFCSSFCKWKFLSKVFWSQKYLIIASAGFQEQLHALPSVNSIGRQFYDEESLLQKFCKDELSRKIQNVFRIPVCFMHVCVTMSAVCILCCMSVCWSICRYISYVMEYQCVVHPIVFGTPLINILLLCGLLVFRIWSPFLRLFKRNTLVRSRYPVSFLVKTFQ